MQPSATSFTTSPYFVPSYIEDHNEIVAAAPFA
jgi:hypothetical protein